MGTNSAWRYHGQSGTPRIFVRLAAGGTEYRTDPSSILLIPNEKMTEEGLPSRTERRGINTWLEGPLGASHYTFKPTAALQQLKRLLSGQDWVVDPTADNNLSREVRFESKTYITTITGALQVSCDALPSHGRPVLDPFDKTATFYDLRS